MARTILLWNGDPRRREAERFIQDVYSIQYKARVDNFPSRLIVLIDQNNEIVAASGLRHEEDRFFSEHYLDQPIDKILSGISGVTVTRGQIFEVSTLASRAPSMTLAFIKHIVAVGEECGFSWSFFTLTRRLKLMVDRLGLAPTFLASADHRRIADFERWGSYYAAQPEVYAVASARFSQSHGADRGRHGFARAL